MLEGALHTTREVIALLTQLWNLWSTIATCVLVSVCNAAIDVKGTTNHCLIWFKILPLHRMDLCLTLTEAMELWLNRSLILQRKTCHHYSLSGHKMTPNDLHFSILIKEISSHSKWQLTQMPTTNQYSENRRNCNVHFEIRCSYYYLQVSGICAKEGWKGY